MKPGDEVWVRGKVEGSPIYGEGIYVHFDQDKHGGSIRFALSDVLASAPPRITGEQVLSTRKPTEAEIAYGLTLEPLAQEALAHPPQPVAGDEVRELIAKWRRLQEKENMVNMAACADELEAVLRRQGQVAVCEGCNASDGRKVVLICAECIRKTSLEARRLERDKLQAL